MNVTHFIITDHIYKLVYCIEKLSLKFKIALMARNLTYIYAKKITYKKNDLPAH